MSTLFQAPCWAVVGGCEQNHSWASRNSWSRDRVVSHSNLCAEVICSETEKISDKPPGLVLWGKGCPLQWLVVTRYCLWGRQSIQVISSAKCVLLTVCMIKEPQVCSAKDFGWSCLPMVKTWERDKRLVHNHATWQAEMSGVPRCAALKMTSLTGGTSHPLLTQTLFQVGVERLKRGGGRCLALWATCHDQVPSKKGKEGFKEIRTLDLQGPDCLMKTKELGNKSLLEEGGPGI